MNTDLQAKIVEEALSWLNTPFHHAARIKGRQGGVDCVNFLIGVFSAVKAAPAITLDPYPQDWHMHNEEQRFLEGLANYAD